MLFIKTSILCAVITSHIVASNTQAVAQSSIHMTSDIGLSDQYKVIHVDGLEETKDNVSGTLGLSPGALIFSNKHGRSDIARDRLVNAFIGDQRTEPWGLAGIIARKVIPYGGGSALGAISNKKVDLLTVEYLDVHDGYHSAVFVLPVTKAAALRDDILVDLIAPIRQHASACNEPSPQSLLLAPIQVRGLVLPDEYRVLIYEQTIKELITMRPGAKLFRAGDRLAGPGCSAYSLHITVTNFRKGNRAVRASTGPLGVFFGTTSLTFDVTLEDSHDRTIFNTQIKKSNRSDSESLGLADSIAKNVAKRLEKVTEAKPEQIAASY